jgi:malate synthase
VEELKACYYPSDLEDLMVKYINDLYPEAAKNITVSDYEVLKGAENVVDQAAASVTASADESSDEKADENAVDSAENASGLTEEEQAQLKAQQEEQKKQQQEIERRSKIIQNVKQAGGYLENEKTRADWDNKLNEIINNLHGEFDTKEPGTGAQTNTGTQTNS